MWEDKDYTTYYDARDFRPIRKYGDGRQFKVDAFGEWFEMESNVVTKSYVDKVESDFVDRCGEIEKESKRKYLLIG